MMRSPICHHFAASVTVIVTTLDALSHVSPVPVPLNPPWYFRQLSASYSLSHGSAMGMPAVPIQLLLSPITRTSFDVFDPSPKKVHNNVPSLPVLTLSRPPDRRAESAASTCLYKKGGRNPLPSIPRQAGRRYGYGVWVSRSTYPFDGKVFAACCRSSSCVTIYSCMGVQIRWHSSISKLLDFPVIVQNSQLQRQKSRFSRFCS